MVGAAQNGLFSPVTCLKAKPSQPTDREKNVSLFPLLGSILGTVRRTRTTQPRRILVSEGSDTREGR
ncbi:hypothetical protein ERO13_A02G065000v2 [Gossypium hirsutum]|nr:hypothetical protein ERO13_A02G065000v2 [Gossypium hirsutum]